MPGEGHWQTVTYKSGESVKLEQILDEAALVHNSTPHVSTKESPYCMLFGLEPTMPGWQELICKPDDETRRVKLSEIRQHKKLLTCLDQEGWWSGGDSGDVAVGDWILYVLSPYEQKVLNKMANVAATSYSAGWSLPARVQSVKAGAVVVKPWGAPQKFRQVPMSQMKVLRGKVPPTLEEITSRILQICKPEWSQVIHPRVEPNPADAREWKEWLDGQLDSKEKEEGVRPAC
eukprot:Platyproteum_vivax@DN7417_c0_g1_i2.p1